MIKFNFLLFFFFFGCSSKPIEQPWINQAVTFYDSYKNAYLAGRYSAAKFYYEAGLKEAKSSLNLKILCRLKLSKVALDIAKLKYDNNTTKLRMLVMQQKDSVLTNYLYLLEQNIKEVNSDQLPKQYIDMVKALQKKDENRLLSEMKKSTNRLSSIIVASIALKTLGKSEALYEYAIYTISHKGYKGLLLEWVEDYLLYLKKIKKEDKYKIYKNKLDLIKE